MRRRYASKTALKLVSATSMTVFSLLSVFTATAAWFDSQRNLNEGASQAAPSILLAVMRFVMMGQMVLRLLAFLLATFLYRCPNTIAFSPIEILIRPSSSESNYPVIPRPNTLRLLFLVLGIIWTMPVIFRAISLTLFLSDFLLASTILTIISIS